VTFSTSSEFDLQVRMTKDALGFSPPSAIELNKRTVDYRGIERYCFPRIGGSTLPAHPFLVWWAISYGLSMLARYEPRGWAQRIAITSSGDAAPIEHLLDQALTVLPELIHRTVWQAAQND